VCALIRSRFMHITKLNVAAIGNLVPQLHVHLIGRHPGDACWPGVVWATCMPAVHGPSSSCASWPPRSPPRPRRHSVSRAYDYVRSRRRGIIARRARDRQPGIAPAPRSAGNRLHAGHADSEELSQCASPTSRLRW
jgi:hypothetical protein